ncbi:MAG: DoxX family protein [FCB group bacterium]|jgi:uncharacterized membrane protein YphA (DoxX/SURF4 family)|nr:DoxX family protein [FCB group bacterium]
MRPSLIRRIDDTGIPLLVARLVLGLMFISMGWSKATEPVAFLKLIHEYELVPASQYVLLNNIAVTLPWIEMFCGVLLLAGVLIRGASLTILVMLTGFTIAIAMRAVGIHNAEGTPFCDIHFDCGCGGGDVYMCRKLPENVGLWLLSLVTLISRSRRFCLSKLFSGKRSATAEAEPEPV